MSLSTESWQYHLQDICYKFLSNEGFICFLFASLFSCFLVAKDFRFCENTLLLVPLDNDSRLCPVIIFERRKFWCFFNKTFVIAIRSVKSRKVLDNKVWREVWINFNIFIFRQTYSSQVFMALKNIKITRRGGFWYGGKLMSWTRSWRRNLVRNLSVLIKILLPSVDVDLITNSLWHSSAINNFMRRQVNELRYSKNKLN